MISLQTAQKDLFQFGGPILVAIGTISFILNVIVFTKKNRRKNPSSIYSVAFNISCFLYIYLSLTGSIITTGYNIDLASNNLAYCRFYMYNYFLSDSLSSFYLILILIDLVLITSSNALRRRRSTRRFAWLLTIGGTSFWILFHSHALIFSTIIEFSPNNFVCYRQIGLYTVLASYYQLIFKAIITPLLMIVLGLWTIKNIRNIRHPNAVISTVGTATVQSKDRQLAQMLLSDIIIYVIFNLIVGIYTVYRQITQYQLKSSEHIYIESFIGYVCVFAFSIPFCISFYIHLFVSKTFRTHVKAALQK